MCIYLTVHCINSETLLFYYNFILTISFYFNILFNSITNSNVNNRFYAHRFFSLDLLKPLTLIRLIPAVQCPRSKVNATSLSALKITS